MASKSFRELLSAWVNQEIIVINPESFRKTMLTEGVALEIYTARVRAVHEDYIEVSFHAQKKGGVEPVDQFIPLEKIKRASVWGGEKYLHL